jgi:hypothetical protein
MQQLALARAVAQPGVAPCACFCLHDTLAINGKKPPAGGFQQLRHITASIAVAQIIL